MCARGTDKEEAHEDAADGLARLCEVIILDGGRDLSRPFSTHGFRRFGVLEDLEVVLLLDLERDPVVDAQLEEDDRRVKDARVQEHGRVFKVDLARDLWDAPGSACLSLGLDDGLNCSQSPREGSRTCMAPSERIMFWIAGATMLGLSFPCKGLAKVVI